MDVVDGKLAKSLCYLSGPMEFVSDHGIIWRRKFIQASKDAGLEIDFIDPTNKPGGKSVSIEENKELQARLKSEGRFQELKKYVNCYRRHDLRYVDNSDFIVAVINPDIPSWGTANEIYMAEAQHKPTFFIIEGGMYKLPNWLFGVIDLEDKPNEKRSNVFETLEDVIDELVQINHGFIPMSDEWVLVRKHIEELRSESQSSPV